MHTLGGSLLTFANAGAYAASLAGCRSWRTGQSQTCHQCTSCHQAEQTNISYLCTYIGEGQEISFNAAMACTQNFPHVGYMAGIAVPRCPYLCTYDYMTATVYGQIYEDSGTGTIEPRMVPVISRTPQATHKAIMRDNTT